MLTWIVASLWSLYLVRLAVSVALAFTLFGATFHLGVEVKTRDAFIHHYIRNYLSDKYFVPCKYLHLQRYLKLSWSTVQIPSPEWTEMQEQMLTYVVRLVGNSLLIFTVMTL